MNIWLKYTNCWAFFFCILWRYLILKARTLLRWKSDPTASPNSSHIWVFASATSGASHLLVPVCCLQGPMGQPSLDSFHHHWRPPAGFLGSQCPLTAAPSSRLYDGGLDLLGLRPESVPPGDFIILLRDLKAALSFLGEGLSCDSGKGVFLQEFGSRTSNCTWRWAQLCPAGTSLPSPPVFR